MAAAAAVRRDRPRHAAARALRRPAPRGSSPTWPSATTTSARSSTGSPRRPARSPPRSSPSHRAVAAAAAVHAPREHDLREPALDARRPRPARRGVQAGRAEAARGARRAAARSPRDAVPIVRDLADDVSRRRRGNDLIELAQGDDPVPRHRRRPGAAQRQGAPRLVPDDRPSRCSGSTPSTGRSSAPTPSTSPAGSTTSATPALYDANGSASRSALSVNAFAAVNGLLQPIPPELRNSVFDAVATRDQRNRCPGSIERPAPDGSNPVKVTGEGHLRPDPAPARPMRRALGIPRRLRPSSARASSPSARASDDDEGRHSYRVELDNAFGLIEGADVKVAGVRAGKIKSMDARPTRRCARSSASRSTEQGFGDLRTDAFCETRPQSLIGEYFVDCQPGRRHGEAAARRDDRRSSRPRRRSPSTSSTTSCAARTASASRSCCRELGAGLAARGEDLNETIRRAVPALRETDRVLALLRRAAPHDPRPLPRRRHGHRRAGRRQARTSAASSSRRATPRRSAPQERVALRAQFQRLPTFLAELRPTMRQLGRAADAQAPALRTLNAQRSAPEAPARRRSAPFARRRARRSARSAAAAKVGKPARGQDAPAGPSPGARRRAAARGLGTNLAITLEHLDDPKFAVEKDPRSPRGGAGLHRPGGAAALRLLPDPGDEPLRLRRPHPEGLGLLDSGCATYFDAEPRRRIPTLEALPREPRPQPAGHQQPRPDEDRDARDSARSRPARRPRAGDHAADRTAPGPARSRRAASEAEHHQGAAARSSAGCCPSLTDPGPRRAPRRRLEVPSAVRRHQVPPRLPAGAMSRRTRRIDRRQPGPRGRGHDARRRRRRLPRLQRQQRPAVRPDDRS